MEFKNLKLDLQDRIATLTFNRPKVLNALNGETLQELGEAFHWFREQEGVGAIIITGEGEKAFVAGADIQELARMSPLQAKAGAERGQALFSEIENFPKPVIAAVNGYSLGGGCELAMACHLRIASANARFGQPEVKLGIIPGYGGTQRLARLVGKGRAMELVLGGGMIDAQEALRIGLVNHVVAPEELLPFSRKMASGFLANGPLALSYCIKAVNAGLEMPLQEALSLEASLFGLSFATEDMTEGTTAFLEKRKAEFQGR